VVITAKTSLVIYNISVTGIGTDHAMITWKTNGDANSTVKYGTTTGYGSTSTNDVRGTSHTIRLYSLSSGTVYHYRVMSTTNDGESNTSADATFKTLSASGTPVDGGGVEPVSDSSVSGPARTVEHATESPFTTVQMPAPHEAAAITPVNSIGPLTSAPLTADLDGMPGVSVSWATQINDNPAPNAQITTFIEQTPDQVTLDAFTTAFHLVGQDIGSLAYVMIVQKTGLTSTGPATITMTAPHDWVTRNGGTDAITIVRMADDGTTEVLQTSFSGYDQDSGYLIFTAASPDGLSIFALVGVKSYMPAPAPTSGQMAPAQAPTLAPVTPAAKTSTGLPLMGIAGVIAALAILGVALLLFIRRNK
jgi:hypothetical protein